MCSRGQCHRGYFSLHSPFSETAATCSRDARLHVQPYTKHIHKQRPLMTLALGCVLKRSVSAWILQLALTVFWNSSYVFTRCQTTRGVIHKAYPQAVAINDFSTWLCVQEVSVSLQTSPCTENLLKKHLSHCRWWLQVFFPFGHTKIQAQ